MHVRELAEPEFACTAKGDSSPPAKAPTAGSEVLVPVTRRFQPDPDVLEKLVEVLWQLLVSAPDCETQATCIFGATE